jgi:hypothetical protein
MTKAKSERDKVTEVLQKAKSYLQPRGAVLQLACVPDTDPYGEDAYLIYIQIKDDVDLEPEQAFSIERELRNRIGKVSNDHIFFRWFTDAEASLEDLVRSRSMAL